MIDFETEIFNAVYPSVAPLCGKNGFRSTHTPSPTAFPAQTLFEMSNITDGSRRSTAPLEDFAVVSYEAHTYATSKAECRRVFSAMDDAMSRIGFSRVSGDYIPNGGDANVHEYVARYRAEIDRNGVIYRRR